MASSFLIVISIWFAINIVFVAMRLWVTRETNWHVGAGSSQLRTAYAQSKPRRRA